MGVVMVTMSSSAGDVPVLFGVSLCANGNTVATDAGTPLVSNPKSRSTPVRLGTGITSLKWVNSPSNSGTPTPALKMLAPGTNRYPLSGARPSPHVIDDVPSPDTLVPPVEFSHVAA